MAITPVQLPLEAYAPGLKASVIESDLNACRLREADAKKAVESARKATEHVEGLDEGKSNHADLKLAVAEKTLAVTTLNIELENARISAGQGALSTAGPAGREGLAKAAARLERRLAVAVAEESLANIELKALDKARGRPRPRRQESRRRPRGSGQSEERRHAPGETYTSLRGSLKTVESNLETELRATSRTPRPALAVVRRWPRGLSILAIR